MIFCNRYILESGQMEHFYSIIFKATDGRERKLGVSAKDYDTWKVGDRAKKVPGKLTLDRI